MRRRVGDADLEKRKARAIRQYKEDAPLKQISYQAGVSDMVILRWVDEAGVPRRKKGRKLP